MLNKTRDSNIKYTAIIPQKYLDELRGMVDKKIIPSVNQGIRAAVEDFIKAHKLYEYQAGMREAADDKAFIARTLETQKAFEAADAEADQW